MAARIHNRLLWHGSGHDKTIDGWGSKLYDLLVGHWFLREFYRRIAAEIAVTVPTGGAVLDAGTGPGMLLVELARRRPDLRITGIDLSHDMITIAQRNATRTGRGTHIDVRRADVADLPFADGSFDLVVSTLSMHHWGAVRPAVTELARVLRPGGSLWIYDLRSLPSDALAAAADEAFDGQPLHRTLPRTGHLPLRPYARWAITRPTATADVT
jgi:ubiquinone/menaquinone biosynthesis C-methylase UbiE